jgi:hypothetical protein
LAIINLGKDVFTSKLLIIFSISSFVASFFLNLNTTLVLLVGGAIAAGILMRKGKKNVVA